MSDPETGTDVLIVGAGPVFLAPATIDASTKAAINQLHESYSQTLEVRAAQNGRITLVRPDGYVACETTPLNGVSPVHHLRSVLERQTTT